MGGYTIISYVDLLISWRKGLRNGNWHRLGLMTRIFYRAATFYAKIRSKITSNRIATRLRTIAEKLETTIRNKITNAGTERAEEMLTRFEQNGVFNWAPRLKTWLRDPKYIFCLGLNSQPP